MWSNRICLHLCVKCRKRMCNMSIFSSSCAALQYTKVFQRLKHSDVRSTASSLFISDSVAKHTAIVRVDLDLENKFRNIDVLKKNLMARRTQNISLTDLVEKYKKMVQLKVEKEDLKNLKVQNAQEMMAFLKSEEFHKDDFEQQKQRFIKKGKDLKKEIKNITCQIWEIEEKVMVESLALPNDLLPTTPTGRFEVLDEHGKIPQVTTKSHIDSGAESGVLKFSPVSPSAYYLLGPLAMKEQELIADFTLQLLKKNFQLILCPDVVKTVVVEGCGVEFKNPQAVFTLFNSTEQSLETRGQTSHDDDIYTWDKTFHLTGASPMSFAEQSLETGGHTSHDDDIYTWDKTFHLTGASPMSFAAYFTRVNVWEENLPLKWYTIGRKYLPRGNTFLKDGLFAVNQATAVELFGASSCQEESLSLFDEFRTLIWNLHKEWLPLLPLRLVNIPSNQLKPHEMSCSSVQIWIPSLNQYKEIASVSACGDYISRRLMIKCSPDVDRMKNSKYLQTIHCSALSVPKVLAAIMESESLQKGR